MRERQPSPATMSLAGGAAPDAPTAGGLGETNPDGATLWRDYLVTGDKGPLLLHYSPLVASIAGRVRAGISSSVETADLVSYATFGLIDAIDKFQPGRDIKFETYASSRIRGAIFDELRNIDSIPRSVRARFRDVERASAALQATLSRTPTESEVAAELGITVTKLRKLSSAVAFADVVLVDDLRHCRGFDDVTFSAAFNSLSHDRRTDQPDYALEAAERARAVLAAIGALRERERAVIHLHYYRGLKLTEIGQMLGVTVARVSQLHTSARLALKERLVAMDA